MTLATGKGGRSKQGYNNVDEKEHDIEEVGKDLDCPEKSDKGRERNDTDVREVTR